MTPALERVRQCRQWNPAHFVVLAQFLNRPRARQGCRPASFNFVFRSARLFAIVSRPLVAACASRLNGTGGSMRRTWLFGLFFLSGASALIYELIWQRLLHLVVGVSTFATSAVLAAFMGDWPWGHC